MDQEDQQSLPAVGYRFYPTEEELITIYLRNQLQGIQRQEMHRAIPVVPIYSMEPWQLPECSGLFCRQEKEQWFFFVTMQEREAHGGRPTRTTHSGYWKATGSPSYVYSCDNKKIGVKKTMVFYKGKAPTGRKTKWKINEYRAIDDEEEATIPKLRHEFSLCRVYVVSGSSRAFDRRPIGGEIVVPQEQHEVIEPKPEPKVEAEPSERGKTVVVLESAGANHSSPETSYSGRQLEERAASTSNLGIDDGLQQSLSEWEQFDWL